MFNDDDYSLMDKECSLFFDFTNEHKYWRNSELFAKNDDSVFKAPCYN
jgi:hypothetical protein